MGKKGRSNPPTGNHTGSADDHGPTPRSHRFGLLSSGV